ASILEQLAAGDVKSLLNDPGAMVKLEQAFDSFMRATKAITVPTVTTLDDIISDYFARRPPFSEKKKAEFPDAIVVASLRAWCVKRNVKAYVVSGDDDLKHCCSPAGPLLHAATI